MSNVITPGLAATYIRSTGGWELATMAEGTPYYLDHNQGITPWHRPELPPYPTAPPKCALGEVWAGFRDMRSFGTARRTASTALSKHQDPDFPGACARGGGGVGCVRKKG